MLPSRFYIKYSIMNRLLLSSLLLAITLSAGAAATKKTLKEALDQGLVQLKAEGQGGYTGKVLSLEIVNSSKKEITLDIQPGLEMNSEDDTQQDLMLTEGRELILASGAKRKLIFNAMCIQASNGAPSVGSVYTARKMAGDTLLKLAKFIAQKKYQNDAAQNAVWVITDGHNIADIYDENDLIRKELVEFTADITGKPIPWYHTQRNSPAPGMVYNPTPSIISGVYKFSISEPGTVRLAVYNEEGKEVYLIRDNTEVHKGDNTMKFTLQVYNYPKGKYYARLQLNGVLKEEKVFEL